MVVAISTMARRWLTNNALITHYSGGVANSIYQRRLSNMIWNFIRDFIVEHITGGLTSTGAIHTNALIGLFGNDSYEYSSFANTQNIMVQVGKVLDYDNDIIYGYISFGDWLATTLTTICMCLIVAFAIWLVIWVFKAVAHAFLLRR